MPTKNNSELYYNNIRDRLSDLVGAVERDPSRLWFLPNIHCEAGNASHARVSRSFVPDSD